jgi:hypothetical protein
METQITREDAGQANLESPDFSLVLGGPLFQLFRRTRLSGDALELLLRRILVITLFAWLPLLILSLIEGSAFGGALKIPFLYDVEAHARFLVALPALIIAEVVVHRRISPLARRLVERRIVVTEDLPRFRAAVESALRARNSVALEVVLLALVYTLGLWIWRSQVAVGAATWYATPGGGHLNLTPAGCWYALTAPSERVRPNMACSPIGMCSVLRKSGSEAAQRIRASYSAPPISSRWPIWETATPSWEICGSFPLDSRISGDSPPQPQRHSYR